MGTRLRHWPYAAAGLLSAGAGMAGGHLLAAWVNPAASPVLAIGSMVIDATPTPLKEFAVRELGTNDKPVLLASVALGAAAAAAVIGLLSRRRPRLGVALIAGLAALTGLAAALRPTAQPLDVLPAVATAFVGAATLVGLRWTLVPVDDSFLAGVRGRLEALLHRAGPGELRDRPAESPLDHTAYAPGAPGTPRRRSFLLGAAGVAAGSTALGVLGQRLGGSAGALPSSIALPAPAKPLAPLPTGIEGKVNGVSPFRTPVKDFYRVDTALAVPRVDVDRWQLTIDGMVDKPFELTYRDLLAMPLVERDITLNCVSNEVGGPYISATRWLGVPVKALLERAGLRDGVEQILSTATDGMTISTPVGALTDDRGALVAVAMDGKPLTPVHGFPVRLVTPGLYGFVGATKWLTKLTATTYADKQAYWTKRKWATNAPVKTQARIDVPQGLQTYQAGKIAVGGVAWSQATGGVAKVEVRVDDGPWRAATMGADAGTVYWRQWSMVWDATPGRHEISVRATDGQADIQTDKRANPFPNGASGRHTVVVLVS